LATIDEAESRWYAELLAMALPERRPSWLRALWSRLDGAAHLPEHRNGPSGVGAR